MWRWKNRRPFLCPLSHWFDHHPLSFGTARVTKPKQTTARTKITVPKMHQRSSWCPQYPKTNRKDGQGWTKNIEKWPAKVRLTDLGVSWARQDHGAAVLRCVQFSRTTSRPDFEAEQKSKLWKSKGLWIPWIPWTMAIECYRYLWSSSKFRAISTDQFVKSNSETQTLSTENSIHHGASSLSLYRTSPLVAAKELAALSPLGGRSWALSTAAKICMIFSISKHIQRHWNPTPDIWH